MIYVIDLCTGIIAVRTKCKLEIYGLISHFNSPGSFGRQMNSIFPCDNCSGNEDLSFESVLSRVPDPLWVFRANSVADTRQVKRDAPFRYILKKTVRWIRILVASESEAHDVDMRYYIRVDKNRGPFTSEETEA